MPAINFRTEPLNSIRDKNTFDCHEGMFLKKSFDLVHCTVILEGIRGANYFPTQALHSDALTLAPPRIVNKSLATTIVKPI